MSPVRTVDNCSQLRIAWNMVFDSANPFSIPFRESIPKSLIFYPTDGYYLTPAQFEALSQAASEPSIQYNISLVEYAGDFFERGSHWNCVSPSYQDYRELPLILENALYSSTWGALVSHEDHAIVGGSDDFIARIRVAYPGWRDDCRRLRETWARNPAGDWVDEVLGLKSG